MAGDWIPMRCDLTDDPAVIGIASDLDIPESHVVGLLHRTWSWASCQTVDGNAPTVTFSFLDRYVGVTGFAEAMERHGWLCRNRDGLGIPHFDRYNSESAKTRAKTRIRVQKHRNGPSVTEALPEKRREEKRRENPKEDSLPAAPPEKPVKQQRNKRERAEAAASIYQAYPRHVGKQAALKAIAKALESIPADELLPKVEAYASSQDVQTKLGTSEEQFIPHPTTWFNQGRWMDESGGKSRGAQWLEGK